VEICTVVLCIFVWGSVCYCVLHLLSIVNKITQCFSCPNLDLVDGYGYTTRNNLICDVTILSRIKLNSSQINIRDDLHFRGGMSVID
jgi:hypothetical protein